jgi:hypothetical protein
LESRAKSRAGSGKHYQRSTDGSKLFITFFFRQGSEPAYRTLIVSGDGVREISAYANVWYDDQENPVFRLDGGREWYEDDGKSYRFFSKWDDSSYIFKTGAVLPHKALTTVSDVKGVVGGDLVLVRLRDKPAWFVSSSENPRHSLVELPKDWDHPQSAFVDGRDLVIFGTWRQPKFLVKCLIYRKSSDGYRLSEEIPIPWGSDIYDLNMKTGDALITGKGQFSSYYRFNIRSKKRSRLGFAPSDDVLFLKEDVIKTLDNALKKDRKHSK